MPGMLPGAGASPPGSAVPGVLCGGIGPAGSGEPAGPAREVKCTLTKTATNRQAATAPPAHVHDCALQNRCGAGAFSSAPAASRTLPVAGTAPLAGSLTSCGIGGGAPCSLRASRILIVPARFLRWASNGGVNASSQCTFPMKYSRDLPGSTSSMRKGRMATPRLTARSTSLRICGEALALAVKTSTIIRHCSMASMMASPHSMLGITSRGAIQQRMPFDSSMAQTASAVALSFAE